MLQSPNFILKNFFRSLEQRSNSWQRCKRVWMHRYVSLEAFRYSRRQVSALSVL
jgi:hypothetical protein